ncbi:hypothetical protein LX32DRAFT_641549 [Colletotrichum zoysiae]|uniref:Uncharacterized protein n=1 Tax=Colletotrichum zoysiae TaxID=1216348 RepID=A0AAD9LZM2_9PEZI|nr:hypothetical protein LX32DRAFT_641549 [Colletotrichum zoysiae]
MTLQTLLAESRKALVHLIVVAVAIVVTSLRTNQTGSRMSQAPESDRSRLFSPT